MFVLEALMARYQHYDYGHTRLVAINYAKQILRGTFENEVSASGKKRFLTDYYYSFYVEGQAAPLGARLQRNDVIRFYGLSAGVT